MAKASFLSCVAAGFLAACVCQTLPTAVGSDRATCFRRTRGSPIPVVNGSRWIPYYLPSEWVGRIQNPYCLVCTCLNGEVECDDASPQCPPTPCPPDQRVLSRRRCCPRCVHPNSDVSEGSGSAPPVHAGCWDELGKLRQHGSCWNISYQGQATCIGACCRDGETSEVTPKCPPVPRCKSGEQPYSGPLQCCRQCSVGGAGAPRSVVGVSLKECEGKRPYRVFLANPKLMDAFAYSIVNADRVHVVQWNSAGAHSVKMSKAAFAGLPQRSLFLYQGRSTTESVSDLVNNSTKVQRTSQCQLKCAQLVVTMLEPSMQPVRLEDC